MGYCFEKGIPHSEFLTWEPADRAKVLAFAQESALRCNQCGTMGWEWDPEQGGDKFAYEATIMTCPGCRHREALQQDQKDRPLGSTVILVPRDTAERLRMQLTILKERQEALQRSKEAE
jgi:hypothetical protein